MRFPDLLAFAWQVLGGYRARTALILLAMGIGVAAVVAVSSIGEGARLYIVNQFGSLGTNLVIVLPGRSETAGAMPGVLVGKTPRDITIDDALALKRSPAVLRFAPLIVGAGDVRVGSRSRETPVLGTTAEFIQVRQMDMAHGVFLPPGDPRHSQPVCVIGATVAAELFGARPALGEWLRIGDRRFRIVGVLAKQGQSLGFNTDEIVVIPLAAAQALFNTEALFRVLVEAKSREQIGYAKDDIEEILRLRHEGERDVTAISQDAVLATFDRILGTLTLAVGGIAAISLAVAGILIMNVMLIAVTQRRKEIGLLKAIGATGQQIRAAFFTEAVMLALGGAACGLLVGKLAQVAIGQAFPDIPFTAPWWAVIAAPLTAVVTSVLFTVLPAKRAAALDPVMALSKR
ncbi:MAG: ABC transporter permease [Zoogloeaceae bacterium]|jgi:putative ABC transport system permease protein|nr:ABC transporter permease [Zoogloeaceae bacterium]MCZ2175484.1 ABC transporter permease [Burkholderiales bacterium]OQY70074.1 MAG: peptide ABC transporter permease [Rhodocyclaceae bacterium UTPRO2]